MMFMLSLHITSGAITVAEIYSTRGPLVSHMCAIYACYARYAVAVCTCG